MPQLLLSCSKEALNTLSFSCDVVTRNAAAVAAAAAAVWWCSPLKVVQ
mgnify:CR=1 FL=1